MLGIKPENEFEAMSSFVILEALDMKLGISPLSSFPDTRKTCKFGTPSPMFAGRLPES